MGIPRSRAHAGAGSVLARAVACGLLAACAGPVQADDDDAEIEFDRPGLAFATRTLPAGGFAWEQGLPDAGTDRRDGVRTTAFVADTTLRFGLVDSLELQLEHDTLVHVRTRGQGVRASDTGSGGTSAGLLWALPGATERFEWSVLATSTVARGCAAFGDEGDERSLGMTASWITGPVGSVTVLADRSWTDEGPGWLFAADYVREVRDDLEAYVELGIGTGEARQRVAGAGMMWRPRPTLQFDVSFLRALDRETPDWQAGVGFALYFAPR